MYSDCDTPKGWVAPFGYPRINACSRLPVAFRSVPRPSSPPGAKASTECPYFARDHQVFLSKDPPPCTETIHGLFFPGLVTSAGHEPRIDPINCLRPHGRPSFSTQQIPSNQTTQSDRSPRTVPFNGTFPTPLNPHRANDWTSPTPAEQTTIRSDSRLRDGTAPAQTGLAITRVQRRTRT